MLFCTYTLGFHPQPDSKVRPALQCLFDHYLKAKHLVLEARSAILDIFQEIGEAT